MLLSRPDHAVRIATIASAWTQVEISMANLLASSFGSSVKDGDGAHSINRNFVALEVMTTIENNRSRLMLIDSTLGRMLKNQNSTLLPEWQRLSKNLTKCASQRNEVIHGHWSVDDAHPGILFKESRDEKFQKYTVNDLDSILDSVANVYKELHDFMLRVLDAKLRGDLNIN